MSLKSKIILFWEKLKSLFDKIDQDLIEKAITAVNNLKAAIESGTYDSVEALICAIIPTDWDQKISDAFQSVFTQNYNRIILYLKVAGIAIDEDATVDNFIAAIKKLTGDERSEFLNTLATEFTKAASDGQFTRAEISYMVDLVYEHMSEEE